MNARVGTFWAVILLVGAAALGGAGQARAAAPPTLTIEVIGSGTVTGTGITCGLGSLTCYSAYGSSTNVTLTATPASGWTFVHWEDGCSGPTCTFTGIAGNNTATAVFSTTGAVQTSTFSASSTNGDITNGSMNYPIECDSSSTAPAGTACSLTALAGSTLS